MLMRVLLLLLLEGIIAQETAVQADSCPANTFTCNDGSCIPLDWVGDGEADCDDESDEGSKLSTKGEVASSTSSSTVSSAVLNATTSVQEEQEDCPPSHLDRIDSCSQPTFDLLSTVQSFNFNHSSILPQSLSLLSPGCDISREYDICIEGASKKCQSEPSVPAWRSSETFFCQLLLPSVNEHTQCFGSSRPRGCLVEIGHASSTMCRLITSVLADMECIERTANHSCTEDARSMLGPIKEECLQLSRDLSCPSPSIRILTTQELLAKEEEERKMTKPEVEFDNDEEVEEGKREEETIEETSTQGEDKGKEMEEKRIEKEEEVGEETTPRGRVEEKQVQASREREEEEEEEDDTVTTTQPPTTTLQSLHSTTTTILVPSSISSQTTPTSNLPQPPLANVIRSLQVLSRVCSTSYDDSVWKDVHSLLCASTSLQSHSDCWTKLQDNTSCQGEMHSNSSCNSLESFNENLDCLLEVMNDECDVTAQNAIVDLQERANDKLIEKKCFETDAKEERKEKETEGAFKLHPNLPPCSDDQENGALACLVELVEVNKQLLRLQQLDFLLEISRPNSTVMDSICSLYAKYESCLTASVFSLNPAVPRCAFASPLNSLARIGLSPMCSPSTRGLLSSHQQCLFTVAQSHSTCQSALSSLGQTVQAMIHGAHGEALLCKSFYLIRQAFECGKISVEKMCDEAAVRDLGRLRDEITMLGEEEGCPETEPPSLDALLAAPVTRAPIPAPRIARPLPPQLITTPSNTSAVPRNPQVVVVQPVMPVCDEKEQQKFQSCVQDLTQYQPHPLIVIRQPKLIDEACDKFDQFKKCAQNVGCRPIWSKGMSAMLEYACNEARDEYKEVRGCLRKVAGGDVVRECVGVFSKGAPQQACLSANALLACSIPIVNTECGDKAVQFVTKYMSQFATAIDTRCKLAMDIPIGKVIGVGCSLEEEAVIEHCAAPLNDIGSRLDEMFQGGVQSLVKNANSLAPVFAGGCNLTTEFEMCVGGITSSKSPCVVSSCMIKAGESICSSPDPVKAIDTHLSCVFSQIQEPSFAKCLRTTLSTIKHFSLASFKAMLPKFVTCVSDIVEAKCGEAPLKILRSISSPDVCPLQSHSHRIAPISPVNIPPPVVIGCSPDKKKAYRECGNKFFSTYRMLPISLINNIDNIGEFCATLTAMDECSISTRVCASKQDNALKELGMQICATEPSFDKHKICLQTVAQSQESRSCLSQFLTAPTSAHCTALQTAAGCMAKQIQASCGEEALGYSFDSMNVYASVAYDGCKMEVPSVALSTQCSEADLVSYLTCETHVDSFSPRPLALLSNVSLLSQMCNAVETLYRPCLDAMTCKFEPLSSATVSLYRAVCEEQVTRKDHINLGQCIADFTNTKEGRECIRQLTALDLLNTSNKDKLCDSLSSTLICSSPILEKDCGYESIIHLYSLYAEYVRFFDKDCVLSAPGKSLSSDAEVEQVDEEVPSTSTSSSSSSTSSTSSSSTTTTSTTTEKDHPKDVRSKGAIQLLATSYSILLAILLLTL